ncbi:family 20 glycosylhydrolase [Alteromonas facilis]|uniref:family 20 glycosylhydrolase n=1 Tax=Alteromonas facilis TaxID=2048004 RepID=UPI000C287145|nr:family 20 glycosylhydrolase [Alteromonas facilis]
MHNLIRRRLTTLSILALISGTGITGCSRSESVVQLSPIDQAQVELLANTLGVHYQVDNNQAQCETLDFNACFNASLTFSFSQAISAEGWSIYFSHLSPITNIDTQDVTVKHINGDLHQLRFNRPINTGEVFVLPLEAAFWHVNRSDIMPNMYIDGDNIEPTIIHATRGIEDKYTGVEYAAHAGHWDTPKQTLRSQDDQLAIASAEYIYSQNQQRQNANVTPSPRIVPKVKKASWSGDRLSVNEGIDVSQIRALTLGIEALEDSEFPFNQSGMQVIWQVVPDMPEEHYGLSIKNTGIEITASSESGANYALLSLAQLFDDAQTLPLGSIEDEPHYAYRGMHMDIARNFVGQDAIFSLLDEMFYAKLNRLHLHFADDEGWRVEISDMPELTDIGAFRCANEKTCILPQLGSGPDRENQVNGYISRDDYIKLLQYAAQRNIEVIPSFDVPGHARAAIESMEKRYQKTNDDRYRLIDPLDITQYQSIQYYSDNTVNPCIDSTYRFIDSVVDELQRMHNDAGTPLSTFHLGADETAGAWIQSPMCEQLLGRALSPDDTHKLTAIFIKRVYDMVKQKGLVLAGWSDGMSTLDTALRSDNMLVTLWKTLASNADADAVTWTQSEAKVVYSFPDVLYFDFPYQNHPMEPGYYWASKNTDLFKVFQFTPDALPVHQWLWQDRMGNKINSGTTVAPNAPLGIQGQVWSEAIRSKETLEYMIYPRLYALGERAWSSPAWQQAALDVIAGEATIDHVLALQTVEWQEFIQQIVGYHLPRLALKGVNFRLPPPGVMAQQDGFLTNPTYPGLITEYLTPQGEWMTFSNNSKVDSQTLFRSRLNNTSRVSRPHSAAQLSARKGQNTTGAEHD